MTPATLLLVLVCMVALVAGQLLLKLAMHGGAGSAPRPMPTRVGAFAGGIVAMTVWFMLWLGLLGHMDLSHLFPFEGLASIMLSLAACWLLKERATARTWGGVLLIALGVALVAMS